MKSSNRRVGVVGVPDGWSSIALADAFEARTDYRLLIDMSEVIADLSNKAVYFEDVNLCELDALVIKKIGRAYSPDMLDRLELLRFVEESGVSCFSPPSRIIRLLDRLSCTITLRAHDIPMPETVVTESTDAAVAALQRFGEAVMKPLYSTKARGMELVDATTDDLQAVVGEFSADNPVMYIQRRLKSLEKDLGVVFMGGEYVGTYARLGSDDAWNTTIRAGGRYAPYEPSNEVIELARRAQAPFGLEFTSVDVVETPAGPMCFEVSAFGGFRGLTDGLGIDAAGNYADHILKRLGDDS